MPSVPGLPARFRYPVLLVCVLALAATGVLRGQGAASFLDRHPAAAVRVMTWNIGANSVFPRDDAIVDAAGAGRPAQFARVLRALQPDIICLQEVTTDVRRAAEFVGRVVPPAGGRAWDAHGQLDSVILSHFALRRRGGGIIDAGPRLRGHAVALVDVPGLRPDALYVVCAHFQSSDGPVNIDARERHADMLIAMIREAARGRSTVPMGPRTPFVILGDLNAIPSATGFLDRLLTGAARTGARPSTGGGLDWDGSALTDALPRHNATGPDTYTWRNDLEPFPASALDRVLYSDSVLAAVHGFVLNTLTLSHDEIRRAGLRAIDVMREPEAGVHDHLPVVVDFALR